MPPEVPRDCIECDAGCGKSNPRMKCSRCHCNYYCSRECQRKDWRVHKPNCHDIDTLRKKLSLEGATLPVVDAVNTQCPICLTHEMNDPVVLNCRHAYCFLCAKDYQRFDTNNTKCQVCRTLKEEDSDELSGAMLLIARADKKDISADERNSLNRKALDELSQLEGGEKDFEAKLIKAGILVSLESYKEAVELILGLLPRGEIGQRNYETFKATVEHADNLIDNDREEEAEQLLDQMKDFQKNNNCEHFPPIARISVQLSLAEAYQGLQQWQQASDVYLDVFEKELSIREDVIKLRKWIMGRCRCLYELGQYDSAIETGELAIELGRHSHGVHRYVAFAHFAKGNLHKARTLLQRAAIYETPWHDQKRQEAYDEWRKFAEFKE